MTALLYARRGADLNPLFTHNGLFQTVDVSSVLRNPVDCVGVTLECETDATTQQLCGVKPAGGLHIAEFADLRLQSENPGGSGLQRRQCTVVCSLIDGGGGAKNIDLRSPSTANHFYIVAEWGLGFEFLNVIYDRITTLSTTIIGLDQWATVTGNFGADSGNVECVFVRLTNVEAGGLPGVRPTTDSNNFFGRYQNAGAQPQVTAMCKVDDNDQFQVYIPERKFGNDPATASAIQGWVTRDRGLYMLPEIERTVLPDNTPTWRNFSARCLRETGFQQTGPGYAPVASTIILAKAMQPLSANGRRCGLKTIHDKIGDRWLSNGTVCKPMEMDHAYRCDYQKNDVGSTQENVDILGYYTPRHVRPFEDGAVRNTTG